ncbi:MAG: hypothetical protein ABEJ95_03420 [Candidatus Nanohalobium sp.]
MSNLDDAFVDDDPDEDKLGDIVNGRVKIITKKGQIRSGQEYDKLSADQKIICCMAAVRAMELREVIDSMKMSPSELAEICPVPKGTIQSKINGIEVLENDGDGNHHLPGYNLDRAINLLEVED